MSLAAMLAKQKAQKEAQNVRVPATTPDNGRAEPADSGTAAVSSGPVASPVAEPVKVRFGAKKPEPAQAQPEPASESTPTPTPASSTPVVQVDPPATVSNAVMTLDDLNDSEDEGTAPREGKSNPFAFDDEIPCDVPERVLPDDLTKQQKEFVSSVDSIYSIMHDPELFGGVVRTIMAELQEEPGNMNLMMDQDVHVMIRGLRSSMGLAKIKKAEKTVKGRAAKKAPPTTQIANTLDEMFNADDF